MKDTLNCLESIYQHAPRQQLEIICVDNCSHESALPAIWKIYPEVRTFSAPQRQGFARNYNLGLRNARGKYLLILNNDTLLHPGALDALLGALQEDDSLGMVGPKLLSRTGRIQIDCARPLVSPLDYVLNQLLLDLALPMGKLWGRYRAWRLEKRASGSVPCISGACMLVSRQALDEVGLLDEGFDFYYEDIEWCHRMQARGFKIGYVSEARITHLGDRSLSRAREWAKKSEYLSALRYFRRYHALSHRGAWTLWVVTMISFHLRWFAFWLIERISNRTDYAAAYLRLSRWIIQQKPAREDEAQEQNR
ncbi:MAG: glycosyltransferase family 2 protein [Anaerolineales bacterium]|nr:glycosyltransferase family 2 protein [Anaerolineales bacterium]